MNRYSKNIDIALLLLRIVTGAIFIVAGFGKLTGIAGIQEFFGGVGIPLPGVTAWLVGLVELIGGLMVLAGAWIRVPALLLAIVMVGAILFVKLAAGWDAMRIDLALLAITVSLFLTGAGRYSVDHSMRTEERSAEPV